MKATKKIVGAACALVAAVALSAGATFAWFSQSGTVSATGMNVQATTSKNLVISNASTGTFGTTAAASDTTTKELTPTSSADGKEFFYVTNPETVDYATGAAKDGTIYANITGDTSGTATYTASYSYWVKAEGKEDTEYSTLYVSKIEIKAGENASSKDISKALRVSVTYGTTTYIYAPVTGATTTYDGVAKAGTVGTDTGLTSAVTLTTTYVAANNLGTVTTTAAEVKVNVWYEGQDANCTSGNSINVEELSVAISFTAADATT